MVYSVFVSMLSFNIMHASIPAEHIVTACIAAARAHRACANYMCCPRYANALAG